MEKVGRGYDTHYMMPTMWIAVRQQADGGEVLLTVAPEFADAKFWVIAEYPTVEWHEYKCVNTTVWENGTPHHGLAHSWVMLGRCRATDGDVTIILHGFQGFTQHWD